MWSVAGGWQDPYWAAPQLRDVPIDVRKRDLFDHKTIPTAIRQGGTQVPVCMVRDPVVQSTPLTRVEALDISMQSIQGRREYQEDRMKYLCDKDTGISQYWVVDGHGGSGAADWWIARLTDRFAPLLTEYQSAALQLPSKTQRHELWIRYERDARHLVIRMEMEYFREILTLPETKRAQMGGCMIVGAMVLSRVRRMIVLNLGDSRAIVARSKSTQDPERIFLATLDHKPVQKDEMRRIQRANGFVHNRRTQGSLAASRAAGDAELKLASRELRTLQSLEFFLQTPLVSFRIVPARNGHGFEVVDDSAGMASSFVSTFQTLPVDHWSFVETRDEKSGETFQTEMYHPVAGPVSTEPDIYLIEYSAGNLEWVVLASDGLWDVMKNAEVVKLLDDPTSSRSATLTTTSMTSGVGGSEPDYAQVLVEEAYYRGSQDNITAVVIHLSERFVRN